MDKARLFAVALVTVCAGSWLGLAGVAQAQVVCDSMQKQCGSFCVPSNSGPCCADRGLVCTPGFECTPTGGCIGVCAQGTYRCGERHCARNGMICCASVGHPELTCDSDHICNADGTCELKESSKGGCSVAGTRPAHGRRSLAAPLLALAVGVWGLGWRRRRRGTGTA